MRRKILIVMLVIAVAVTVWSWWENDRIKASLQQKQISGQKGKGKELEQKVLSFTIDGRSPGGVKQWHLEGTSAEIIGDDIHLKDLKAVAYGEEATVNLVSDRGIYRKDKGEVELIGNVDVVSDAGFKLITERARWSQMTKEISTDSMVYIEGEGIAAIGKGGKANSEEKWAMLNEEIIVTMEPSTTVNCNGPLKVSYQENKAVFYDNVEVEDKDGKLFADKLTVNIDPSTKKLAQVIAEGNVKLKRGNSYSMSEKAIYTDSTKHAQLLGKPRVIIDPVQLSEIEGFGKGKKKSP